MSVGRFAPPDLPLMRWGDELRRRRQARRRARFGIAMGIPFVSIVLASAGLPPVPRLIWNASASTPLGLYAVTVGRPPKRGDRVVARLAPPVARLAAERGYLPPGVPVLKRVMGLPGDRICADRTRILINDRPAATRLDTDVRGRALPVWKGCIRLGPRRYFLLNADAPGSFDGRYFGPTDAADILGVATPLWLR